MSQSEIPPIDLLHQKIREYDELKSEYEAYKNNANEIETLLESELAEAKQKLEKADFDLKNQKIKEESLKNELSRLRQDFDHNKKKSSFLEVKNIESEKAIDRLESELKILENLKQFQNEKQELEEKLSKSTEEILNLRQKFEQELENLVVQVRNKEVNEIAEKYERKLQDLNAQISTLTTSLQSFETLEKEKKALEIEVTELRKQINNSDRAISEDIEILEDDLEKEYEKKQKTYEITCEKRISEKFLNEYEEKMRVLKEGYDREISKMQVQLKNLEEEIENRSKARISSEYEKKLIEIKNKYEFEITCMKENILQIESSNERNNDQIVKNLKKACKNEKKALEEKIDKLTDEKNLLIQEKKAWEGILRKNSKLFENNPSFFTSSYFMKSESIEYPSENYKNPIFSYLYLMNKSKQSQGYRIESNSLILTKAKKEKTFKFREIFVNEDSIVEHFSKLLELKSASESRKSLILLLGPKKTKKKYFLVETIEQLIINFLDAIRSNNFSEGDIKEENEINSMNYELKVGFEQYPLESNSKDVNFSLNCQFYVSQMISHHQKLTASIESSFNKFKTAFMKRSYLNKNENAKKIRVFKMSVIRSSEKKFFEEIFYILTSNKRPSLPKTNRFDFLEDVLSLPGVKIPEFDSFKDCQKHVYYLIDGSKVNDLVMLGSLQKRNSEEEIDPSLNFPISAETRRQTDVNLGEMKGEVQKQVQKLKEERQDLKAKIEKLNEENLSLKGEIAKHQESRQNQNYKSLEKPVKEAPKPNTVVEIPTKIPLTFNSPKKEQITKEAFTYKDPKKFSTPRAANKKKMGCFEKEENPMELRVRASERFDSNEKNVFKETKTKFMNGTNKEEAKISRSNRNESKAKIFAKNSVFKNDEISNEMRIKEMIGLIRQDENLDSDEGNSNDEMMMEENPRPFPGKFALQRLGNK